VHQEAKLVDQPGGKKPPYHEDRARDEHCLDGRAAAQSSRRLNEVAVDQLDVPPPEVARLPGRDNFRMSPRVFAKAASSPPAASRAGQAPAKLS